MTDTTGPGADLESELHRRYSQAFQQYSNLTRTFLEQWQKGTGSLGTIPGAAPAPDLTKTLSDWFQQSVLGGGADPAQAWTRLAGLAGGSASRDTAPGSAGNPLEQVLHQQEQVGRRLFELAAQCQRLQTQLASHWAAVGQRTAQGFLTSLQAAPPASSSDPAQLAQNLYSAWIDTAEKAYQEAASGAEYVQLLASLTNTANAFKSEQNRLIELWAKYFDNPTRSELDALQREMRELRNELRELRRAR